MALKYWQAAAAIGDAIEESGQHGWPVSRVYDIARREA